jgi:large subunit ribosomal protein L19
MDLIQVFEKEHTEAKKDFPNIRPGDSVKVYQKIKEAGKTKTQSFEGIVIRTRKMKTASANFTVRKISLGVGVEKTFPIHSPNITKIKILKRGKVRRAKLYYIREREGKLAQLKEKESKLGEWKVATAETQKEPQKGQKEEEPKDEKKEEEKSK